MSEIGSSEKKRNVEIKARINDPKSISQIAHRLSMSTGTNFTYKISQDDYFYDSKEGRLKLRVIDKTSGQLIYYERDDKKGPKISNYIIVEIENYANFHAIFSKTNTCVMTVKKNREVVMIGQTRVHIDEVEDLGWFVEFEVVLESEQTESHGEEIAKNLMVSFGIKDEDLERGAYADLLKQKKQENKN